MRGRLVVLTLAFLVVISGLAGCGETLPTPPPTVVIDAEHGVPIGPRLQSAFAEQAPTIDGVAEADWEKAPPLSAPLHYGLHGTEPAGQIELRSLHDEDTIYLLARWPAESHGGDPDTWRNAFTWHWGLVDPGLVSGESTGSDGLACMVACHTATVDEGQLVGIRNETIPPGLGDDLPAAGGWHDGSWVLEWSRPRVSGSPYDQQITDPEHGYRFFVKIFEGLEDRADPVSDVHELWLSQ